MSRAPLKGVRATIARLPRMERLVTSSIYQNSVSRGALCRRRAHPRGLREGELALDRVDLDRVAALELALEDRERELVDEPLLDHALERPRAVRRVVAEVPQQRPRGVGQLNVDLALAHASDQARD